MRRLALGLVAATMLATTASAGTPVGGRPVDVGQRIMQACFNNDALSVAIEPSMEDQMSSIVCGFGSWSHKTDIRFTAQRTDAGTELNTQLLSGDASWEVAVLASANLTPGAAPTIEVAQQAFVPPVVLPPPPSYIDMVRSLPIPVLP